MPDDREAFATDLYLLGRRYAAESHVDDAIACLRASAIMSPHYKTYELLGELHIKQSMNSRAAVYLAAAVGLSARQIRPKILLATAFLAMGDKESARAQLQEALRVSPDSTSARKLLLSIGGDNPADEQQEDGVQ